jgi:hypothetical protein
MSPDFGSVPQVGEGPILESWKEIAAHFGVTVRTAQKWEVERALPVHRQAGPKGRVWASVSELDEWNRLNSPSGQTPASVTPISGSASHRKWVYIVASLLFGAGALLAWNHFRYREPAAWGVDGTLLTVSDASGEVLWRYQLPFAHAIFPRDPRYHNADDPAFLDIDGDGKKDLLFPVHAAAGSQTNHRFLCFDHRGRLRWTFDPGRPLRTSTDSFDRPFILRHFLLVPPSITSPEPRLVITANQQLEYPMQVVLLSRSGKVLREYWHSGHLTDLRLIDANRDGRPEIWLSGIANGYKAADVVVLDPDSFDGASTEEVERYQLLGFRPPREMLRAIFPRTELSQKFSSYNSGQGVIQKDGKPVIGVQEASDPALSAAVLYEFGPDLRVSGIMFGDSNIGLLRRLYSEGKVSSPDPESERPRLLREVRYLTETAIESARK